MTDKFGLELLRSTVADAAAKSAPDAIVVLTHWRLLFEGLRCCGSGDVFSTQTDTRPTELLPNDWNDNSDVYQLKYKHKKTNEKFVFKAVPGGPSLTLILVRVGDEKTQEMSVDLASECEESGGKVTLKNEDQLLKAIEDKLIRPFFPEEKKKDKEEDKKSDSGSSGGSGRPSRQPPRNPDDPLRDPYPYPDMPRGGPGMPDMPYGPRPGADPFFDPMVMPGGGEMLMERPGRRGGAAGGRFPGGGMGGGGGFPGMGGGGGPGFGFM